MSMAQCCAASPTRRRRQQQRFQTLDAAAHRANAALVAAVVAAEAAATALQRNSKATSIQRDQRECGRLIKFCRLLQAAASRDCQCELHFCVRVCAQNSTDSRDLRLAARPQLFDVAVSNGAHLLCHPFPLYFQLVTKIYLSIVNPESAARSTTASFAHSIQRV